MAARRYAYLNTRVSILARRLVPAMRLDALIDEGPEPGSESRDARPAEVADGSAASEQLLLMNLLRDLATLSRALLGAEREFIEYGVHWFELANLKAIIRGRLSGLPDRSIAEQLVDLGPFATLPVDELLRTEDPAELLRRLEATHYSDIARHARHTFEQQKDLFEVDAAIDRRYFTGLHRGARAVRRHERAAVVALTNGLLDRINLVWLLRYRFSYDLSPAKSYYLLASSGRFLSADVLQRLASQPSLQHVVDALPTPIKRWLDGVSTVCELEDRLERRLRRMYQDALADTGHAVARVFAYLMLRRIEMSQSLAIAKGRRLGFTPELIRHAARTAA